MRHGMLQRLNAMVVLVTNDYGIMIGEPVLFVPFLISTI
jgi:hypothetical protein